MVEISRDGRRVYFTNSLYGAIDEQFTTLSAAMLSNHLAALALSILSKKI